MLNLRTERYAAKVRRLAAEQRRTQAQNNEAFGVAGTCDLNSTGESWTSPPGVGRADCCPVRPPACDCHLLGANTLTVAAGADNTIAAGGTGTVNVDSGDAGYFIPYFMSVVAFESLGADEVDPTDQLLVLLIQSRSGQHANMRRQSPTDPAVGAQMWVYGQHKQVECVDWAAFSSTNNQQLVLTFFNPTELAAHVFVNIWGLPKRKLGT